MGKHEDGKKEKKAKGALKKSQFWAFILISYRLRKMVNNKN